MLGIDEPTAATTELAQRERASMRTSEVAA